MTTVFNLYGGPGSGKSTTATGVFSRLKQADVSCEYVSEYAKDIVWEGTTELLNNQIHVFAEQFRRQWRLIGKVDYIITDSPILLSAVYFDFWFERTKPKFLTNTFAAQTKEYFLAASRQFHNVNFFITRSKPYHQIGRMQSKEEAQLVDNSVLSYLGETNTEFEIINYTTAIERVSGEVFMREVANQCQIEEQTDAV
jgi:hypothetical protein